MDLEELEELVDAVYESVQGYLLNHAEEGEVKASIRDAITDTWEELK